MKMVVGLGNPGFRYRKTRHNIGFMVLDKLAGQYRIRIRKRLFNSLCGKGRIAGQEALLAKPLTYMNLSGRAISEIMAKEHLDSKDLLIIMDDIDLDLGTIRLRPRGSSGGHKGLVSIITELGEENFPRLRIGIGPKKSDGPLSDYVLTPFKRSEREALEESIEKGVLAIEAWIEHGPDKAMSKFNSA